jgi:uncharacterized membrane protein (Fun14 family)
METIFPSVIYQLGIGGVGGFLVGYTLKKVSKLLVFLIGILIVVLIYLGAKGILNVNYEALWTMTAKLFGEASSWLIGFISLLPFTGSFAAGFLLGFKFG